LLLPRNLPVPARAAIPGRYRMVATSLSGIYCVLKGATEVKKMAIVALVLICLGAVLAAGCGDDTATAKSYMEQGDALSVKMRALTSDTVFDAGALLAELGIQISDTGTVDWKTVTDAASKQIDTISANGEKAKAEYEKILDLKGVEAYKEYTRQRTEAIDSTVAVLVSVKSLVNSLGDPKNKGSVSNTVAQWAKSNIRVAGDAVKAFTSWRSADATKKDNNLGQVEEVVQDTAPSSTPK
jgi:hypothetical protein